MKNLYTLITVIFALFVQMNNANSQCNFDDWKALKAFYESTNGDRWNNQTGWDVQIANKNAPSTSCNLSTLYGVEIALGRVKSLNMPNNNLEGSIPGEIGNLLELEYLILRDNKLNGSIPAAIGNLVKLNTILLQNNQLIGSLPNEVGNLNNLTQIYLSFNQLSGEIPSAIGNLSKLFALGLDNNELSGNIPTEIGNIDNLKQLWLQGNNLSDRIPAEIGSLSNLNRLALSVNNLFGCFSANLKPLCTQIAAPNFNGHNNIDNNNLFDARWDDFCASDLGSCESINVNENAVPTNYSGNLNIETTTANILRNNYATIYNHCTSNCNELQIIKTCNRVSGFDNLSANEALWAASNAASFIEPYYSTYNNAVLSPVNIIVNYTCDLQESVFKPTNNTIILGKGDGVERNSMAAPDIVAHEYAHHIINSIQKLNLINYGIPGAISESFADIFGEVVEYNSTNGQNDWVFGGDVIANGASNNGIRSLSNPKDSQMKYQLPNTYKGEHWIDTEDICFHRDLCGVHTNCGVHNYWFYLLANGASGVNDNGYAYNIEGIGIEKAFDIVFENLSNHLSANISYESVMLGSIESAKSLFGDVSNEVSVVIEAWRAVGLDYTEQNPIKFSLLNVEENDPVLLQSGETIIPVKFDLAIDSLGQDLTADNLCFTLHLPDGYLDFEMEEVYPPLTIDEVDINDRPGEVNICIDRQNINAQKTSRANRMIASGEPIVSGVHCIVVIDIGGEENAIDPINISGYTQIGLNEVVSFMPNNLSLGFDTNLLQNGEAMNLALNVNHENCNVLGSIEIMALGTPPYTFSLINFATNSVNSSPTINSKDYQFNNLEAGEYEIVVFDNTNCVITKKFDVDFVTNLDGSYCCPKNLIIPSGINNNFYSASDTISLSMGTLIAKGSLEICD